MIGEIPWSIEIMSVATWRVSERQNQLWSLSLPGSISVQYVRASEIPVVMTDRIQGERKFGCFRELYGLYIETKNISLSLHW